MLVLALLLSGASFAVTAGGESEMPTVDQLPEIPYLPDPFLFRDGTRVKTPEDWLRRRQEIIALLEYYEYGHMPPAPGNIEVEDVSSGPVLDGKSTLRHVILKMGPEHKVRMNVALHIPPDTKPPMPVLLALEPVWK